MKIGTKANAIDDLGKLDTSKMTTKVNGKTTYSQKRYAIVRVDNSCPSMLDDFGCSIAKNMFHCKCGEDTKNYGDTKEQLIKKVAQPLFQREIEIWYEHFPDEKPDKEITKTLYKNCLEQATKIIKLLGVKDEKQR